MSRSRYVVLDRDGTVIQERHYLADPEQVELIDSAAEGMRRMRALGLGLIVITNQSVVGRGILHPDRLQQIHEWMERLLGFEGVKLDGIYYCPHKPDTNCWCRKPQPGLLQNAASDLNFDIREAFVIGDKPCDIDLGRGVGATTFLVRTGYGAEWEKKGPVPADYVIDTLVDAVPILKHLLNPV